ncbi:hypothetical protein HOP60_19670 [Halomonas daqingensis]|uniref:FunZ protein n=1 Tax=Billgrantia desiderata TaxID=52021 RepID=A0ABS9BAQ0_9GAMM|nr:hypothetical protein [Halomonas desiderata]MCE8044369.1 hypothetical protein [Halomonas desiderata]MCE8048943.1 hypothetical protein [Halomonas desiderata]
MVKKNSNTYKEIAKWKVEAKLEDTERYFYKSHAIEQLLDGEKNYVIGRKGSGKSAIANFLKKRSGYDHFAVSLTLKNFPFNTLYEYKDSQHTPPNEYITIWKYIIYTKLLYLICENENIDTDLKKAVESTIPSNAKEIVSKSITRTMSRSFSLSFASFKAAIGLGATNEKVELDWIQRAEALEEILIRYLDNSKYFIVFDELDEDYRYQSIIETDRPYLELITGLFKAAQDIKSIFSEYDHNVNPVIFLRDDIYSLISDHDKSKWSDLSIELKWTPYTMQALIAHRISKAISPAGKNLTFAKAWYAIISGGKINHGKNRTKPVTSYDWITKQTLLRPRDYIRYLQICAEKAYEANDDIIRPESMTTQSKRYSSAFRQELIDEIHTLLPDIEKIFSLFSKIKKAQLRPAEFIESYEKTSKEDWKRKNDSAEYILKLLFLFSVIGNHIPRGGDRQVIIFRYLNEEAELDIDRSIVIHPGLQKSLQLM